MTKSLKELNNGLRKAKAKKAPAKQVAKKPDIDVAAIVKAVELGAKKGIENAEQQVVLPARKPISYRVTIERKAGVMTGARVDPIGTDK